MSKKEFAYSPEIRRAMLKIRSELQGKSVTEVLSKTGFPYATFYRWRDCEVTDPSLHVFVRWCAYFGIKVKIRDLKTLARRAA